MVTYLLFDLCLFKHFSSVANFGYQSLDRRVYRSDFLHQIVATPQNLQDKKQVCSLFYHLCIVKNGHVPEGWKVGSDVCL